MNTLQRSWQLFKASWAVLQADRELLWFPLISGVVLALVTIVFLLPIGVVFGLTGATSDNNAVNQLTGIVLLFMFYLVSNTIMYYFNSALVGAAMIRLDGGDPTLQDGLRLANRRFNPIVAYAALSSTVGVILQLIRERGGFLGDLVASLGGMAWNLATFFVVPILIVKDISAWDAVRESTALFKRTWGEQVVSTGGISVITTIAMVAVAILGIIGTVLFFSISGSLGIMMIITMMVTIMLIGVASSALSGILRAVVYRYAETGAVPDDFDIDALRGVFAPDKKKKNYF